MWLFVGLGNPGAKYAAHRHNIGFMAIEKMADEYGFSPFRSKFQGELSEGRIGGHKVALLKPQTMMNLSGDSVQKAVKFFKIEPERIVIFHDEIALDFCKVRVKLGGGNAGHNGLRSVQSCLGSADYWRVRLGVGHPGEKAQVHNYVLGNFTKAEEPDAARLINAVSEHAPLLVENNMDEFMNAVALKTRS